MTFRLLIFSGCFLGNNHTIKKSVRDLSLVSFSIHDMRSGTSDGVPDFLLWCQKILSLSSAASRDSRHTPFFFLKSSQYKTCLFAVSTQQFAGSTLLMKLLCCKVRRGYKLSDTACMSAARHPVSLLSVEWKFRASKFLF